MKVRIFSSVLVALLLMSGCQEKAAETPKESPPSLAPSAETEISTPGVEPESTDDAESTDLALSGPLNINESIDVSSIGSPDLPASNIALFNEGIKAPDFSAQNRDGNTVSLSDYFGRTLVLNFWASWCPPCIGEMPDLNALDQKWLRGDTVELLTVNLTDGMQESRQSAIDFLDEYSYNFQVLFDETSEISYNYQVNSIPTTYIIKPDGTIYCMIVGATDSEVLTEMLEKIS